MKKEKINEIFEIRESFELPDKIMELVKNNRLDEKLKKIKNEETDLTKDGFVDYFQENHSNRDKMMQDYIPAELCRLVSELNEDFETCLDICAGTGGLTVAMWNRNPDAVFYCEELSRRAFPILLVNLAVRNIKGYAVRKDILTQEAYETYQLEKGEVFSRINILKQPPQITADVVVMNPPYSLKHSISKTDERFKGYEIPPKSKADYVFVMDGIRRTNGKVTAILPHGVLFRGMQEEKIRKRMIQNGTIEAVIGLPEKLFLNTAIPTAVLTFRKNADNQNGILFIDASKSFRKERARNILTGIHEITDTYRNQTETERYSHNATLREMEENNYNLNISRYVDTYIPEPVPDIFELMDEIAKIDSEIEKSEKEVFDMMKQLFAEDDEIRRELEYEVDQWGQITLKL